MLLTPAATSQQQHRLKLTVRLTDAKITTAPTTINPNDEEESFTSFFFFSSCTNIHLLYD
jgi:hypothetical protein